VAGLLRWCEETCGVVFGIGIGDLSGRALRIAHMGHVNAPMVFGSLGVLETELAVRGIPFGRGGVDAAVAHLSAALAG